MTANIELVQAAVGAAAVGDLDTARPLFTEDFFWHIPGTSPISGDIVGLEAYSRHLSRLFAAGLKPQIVDLLGSDDRVAFLQRNVAENGGRSLDISVITLYTLRDGKVARVDTYFGDQPAAEAFWNAAEV